MMVSRKIPDAAAAFSCGTGTVLIVTGLKGVPASVSYLGWFAAGWAVLMVIGCFGAGAGALLRNRATDPDTKAFRRRVLGIRLERICWPAIAWAAVVFSIGVGIRVGFLDGAATISWSGFVICTCIGHWWIIRKAARHTRDQRRLHRCRW